MPGTVSIFKPFILFHQLVGLYRGTFGYVFKAQHVFLTNRIDAIKIMRPDLTENVEEIIRFFREPQYLEELEHPYILPIINAGIYNGRPYQVTKYASKGSLRTRLQRQSMHPLPLAVAITILSQVGQALQHAHDRGVIHRDLKPENILFNEKDAALVADFGIATVLSTSSIKHTHAIGTYQYMAPEEYQDLVCKESDQYALGCIAYEIFTGHLPFQASNTAAIIAKHLTEQPIPPRNYNPELPEHIEKAILKALAKQRTDRHSDISAFITALITTPSGLRVETNKDWMATFVDKAHKVHEIEFGEELTDPEKEDEAFDFQVFDGNDEDFLPYDLDYEPDYSNHFEEELDYFSEDHQTDTQMFAMSKQTSNTNPDTNVTLNEKGLLFVQQEHFQEALVAFEQSLKVNPNQTSIWCYKGNLLCKLLRFGEALDAYEYALLLNPNFSAAYVGKGEALLDLNNLHDALSAFEKAIVLDSKSVGAYIGKGMVFRKLKRYYEALAAYEAGQRADPNNAIVYHNRGNILIDLKRFDEALASFEYAIHLLPKYAAAYTGKGNALLGLQSYSEALIAHEQAIRFAPDFMLAYINKGNVLLELNRCEEALQSYDQAIYLSPHYANAYYGKGNALWYLKREREALAAFDQCIKLDSKYAQAYFSKGSMRAFPNSNP